MGFGLQGFMGENAASGGTAEVLVRTGGFATRRLMRRLLETFQFLLQVTYSVEALQPGGVGHMATIRVRLLHAAVRSRILKLVADRPEYFDISQHGMPINDLDSIHAIVTFCCNHTWLQLPFMGICPRPEEASEYIAVFRYVSHVIGSPNGVFGSTESAKAMMESIAYHELRVTPTSRILANNFVQCLTDLAPINLSVPFIEAGCRVLNGDMFCDELGLGKSTIYSYCCFRGFCSIVGCLAFLQRASPSLDNLILEWFRSKLYETIVNGENSLNGGSVFELKYIPRVGKSTCMESNGRPKQWTMFYNRPFETTLFVVFCLKYFFFLCILFAFFLLGQFGLQAL
ncbi:hypothetical protein NLG97_g8076 [Lecanicillium saksenae]|uniref:Uncharacterized protein n=1 Tax=Lecanicillium saksenae TaxID=468837 RepID=A0ACC1QK24_9HYPO|nr:hypothetical protein NLG97_g8076 [Lecanicillium saksenae]